MWFLREVAVQRPHHTRGRKKKKKKKKKTTQRNAAKLNSTQGSEVDTQSVSYKFMVKVDR